LAAKLLDNVLPNISLLKFAAFENLDHHFQSDVALVALIDPDKLAYFQRFLCEVFLNDLEACHAVVAHRFALIRVEVLPEELQL
jgi:hypothetical protein